MRFLANLRIRNKFLLLPVLAAVLMALCGMIVIKALNAEKALLQQISNEGMTKSRELSRIFSEFSTSHVQFINLLVTASLGSADEGELYAQGRVHILAIKKTLNDIEELERRFDLDNKEIVAGTDLQLQITAYLDQVATAVLMSSVNLQLISKFMQAANQSYDHANASFLAYIDRSQEKSHATIFTAAKQLDRNLVQFLLVWSVTIILIIGISTALANLFADDLNALIGALARLTDGAVDTPVPNGERSDEFGAVNRAMQVFQKALIKRNKVEQDLKQEIEDRTRAEQSLRYSEERFRTLFDDNPLMLFTVNADGIILSVNRFGAHQLGYGAVQLAGLSLESLVIDEDRKKLRTMLVRCLSGRDLKHQWELRQCHQAGKILNLRFTGHALNEPDGNTILLAAEDFTEAQKLSEQLSYQARHDNLTGLINRWEFERRVELVLKKAKSEHSEHVLCYLDLDQFKIINDTCGHIAGDNLLKQIADLLKEQIRSSDTLARLGGDEFGILLEHCPISRGWRMANGLLKTIEQFQFEWRDRDFRIGASIGVVSISELSSDLTQILSDADAACYSAKDAGRNCIHVYAEDDQHLARRRGEMMWASRIPTALEQNRFELYCQKIAPLNQADEHGLHLELLVRMKDEDGNLILPQHFLGATERYNLSTRLDMWVINAAFAWLEQILDNSVDLAMCAINISGQSMGNRDFLKFVLGKIRESRVPPKLLCFEITETAAITNLASAQHFITTLKEHGAWFSLDDFGVGFSSFGYLRELPVDFLKIDGTFIRDVVNNPVHLAMVKSINEIGHILGKKTIAEFVENAEILDRLRTIGVDYVQGYHIAMPRPVGEILQASNASLLRRIAKSSG